MSDRVNTEMIVLARESRGLTQKQLAEKLGIEQYEISRLEGTLFGLPDEILDKLSKELRYPISFFFQNFPIYPVGMNFYRKHKTLPAKELKRIVALMNIHKARISKLLASVDIDFIPLPDCRVEDYGTPEEVAREVRRYLKLPRGRVENMTEILERFGIIVIPYEFGHRKFSGGSLLVEPNTYIVLINEMPADRLRFTLAHELAHLVMHSPPKPTENMEEEADRFASEFLLPEIDIRPHLLKVDLDALANLKLYWKVSMSAILKKAQMSKAISENQYQWLWRKMGKLGYRTSEPKELEPAKEKSTLLDEVIDFHISELRFSNEDLSENLFVEKDEFKNLYQPQKNRLRLVS